MFLNTLKLEQFRNFSEISIAFQEGINILVAKNGAGKSNILEAIHLVATGRSTKTHHHNEIIRTEQQEALVEATLTQKTDTHHVTMRIRKKGKIILWNKVALAKTTDLLKGIVTVYISPEDDYIFSGSPAERRLFLDTLLSKLSPEYLLQLTNLRHVVKNLNSHYKHHGRVDKQLVTLYHEKIKEESEKIVEARKDLLTRLEMSCNQYLEAFFQKGNEKKLKMTYQASYENVNMETIIEREFRYKESCYGAHRDEVSIFFDLKDVRRGISLGERRLLGVLLRLSEKDAWIDLKERRPILLLDDAFLGIDENRQEYLAEILIKDAQTIMTATQKPEHLFDKAVANYHQL